VRAWIKILPRDYYFWGWRLFVRMFLSVVWVWTIFFLGWCFFVRIYLSITQNICLPRDYFFCDSVFLCACICQLHKIYVCLGTFSFVMVSFCAHFFCEFPNTYVCLETIFWGDGVVLCACFCQLPKIYVCLGAIIFGDGHWLKTTYY